MAMRSQSRTVIDPMYIEDTDEMNISKIIMGGPEGVHLAKHYFAISVKSVVMTLRFPPRHFRDVRV
jgi:hypothetical protein